MPKVKLVIETDDETKRMNEPWHPFLLLWSRRRSGSGTGLLLLLRLGALLCSLSLNNYIAVFLIENWAMAGETLKRWCRMAFFLWRRTYSGHFDETGEVSLGSGVLAWASS